LAQKGDAAVWAHPSLLAEVPNVLWFGGVFLEGNFLKSVEIWGIGEYNIMLGN
jgi:hypothetical protein